MKILIIGGGIGGRNGTGAASARCRRTAKITRLS